MDMDPEGMDIKDSRIDNHNKLDEHNKLDLKNIALKAPKKSKSSRNNSFWQFFWINNIPRHRNVTDLRQEYSEIMNEMK